MDRRRRGGCGCWLWALAVLLVLPILVWMAWRFARWVWRVTQVGEEDTRSVRRWKMVARMALVVLYAGIAIWMIVVMATAPPSVPPSALPTSTAELPLEQATGANCSAYAYDRDQWGDYPKASPRSAPTWTKLSDGVNAPAITQDHHVALKDAHLSGGCLWSPRLKNAFASDSDNLNPVTQSFNSSKGSRTPDLLTGIAEEIINSNREKCDYATQHAAVKDKYDLTMVASEQAVVDRWLALC